MYLTKEELEDIKAANTLDRMTKKSMSSNMFTSYYPALEIISAQNCFISALTKVFASMHENGGVKSLSKKEVQNKEDKCLFNLNATGVYYKNVKDTSDYLLFENESLQDMFHMCLECVITFSYKDLSESITFGQREFHAIGSEKLEEILEAEIRNTFTKLGFN